MEDTRNILIFSKKNGYGNRIQLPLEEIKLAFVASCVGGAARKLGVPYIEVYEQNFTAYDKDWLDFIVGNRQGKNPAKDYDYIEGGIANDRVIDTVNLYMKQRVLFSNWRSISPTTRFAFSTKTYSTNI